MEIKNEHQNTHESYETGLFQYFTIYHYFLWIIKDIGCIGDRKAHHRKGR
jgi:hypothetical protein